MKESSNFFIAAATSENKGPFAMPRAAFRLSVYLQKGFVAPASCRQFLFLTQKKSRQDAGATTIHCPHPT
jgi:hypothetical protein